MISPDKRRIAYLKWKDKKKLRKAGLLPPPFQATSEEDRKWQKNKLQRERRVKQGITKANKNHARKPRPIAEVKTVRLVKLGRPAKQKLPILKKNPMPKSRTVKVRGEQLTTIERNLTEMVAVKIDAKTTVYVKKGRDIEEVKKKYGFKL